MVEEAIFEIAVGGGGLLILAATQDIWRSWLYKKLHNHGQAPTSQKDFARTMMMNEHALEQIKHEQNMEVELGRLAVIRANRQVIEQRAAAHLHNENEALLALPNSSINNEALNGKELPPFLSYKETSATTAKNGKTRENV